MMDRDSCFLNMMMLGNNVQTYFNKLLLTDSSCLSRYNLHFHPQIILYYICKYKSHLKMYKYYKDRFHLHCTHYIWGGMFSPVSLWKVVWPNMHKFISTSVNINCACFISFTHIIVLFTQAIFMPELSCSPKLPCSQKRILVHTSHLHKLLSCVYIGTSYVHVDLDFDLYWHTTLHSSAHN